MAIEDVTQLEAAMESPKDDRIYPAYDSGEKELERCFQNVILESKAPFKSIREFTERFRRQFNSKPSGLELAGQGKILVELGIKGAACMLAIPKFLNNERGTKISLIAGDLAKTVTLAEIENRFESDSIAKPALILYPPAGGLSYLPQDMKFYGSLTDWMVSVSDTRSFLILGEYPKALSSPFPLWFKNKYPDCHPTTTAHSDGGYFLLTKH